MNGRRTVKKTDSGNPITLTDSVENKSLGLKLYGWSKQDGEPSPDNPVEIESAGMRWSMGKNLVNADDYYSAYKQADGTYKSKTVTLNDIRISLSEFVGKEITISVKLTVGANVSGVFLMYISSEQKKINGSVIRSGLTGKSILTITPVSNTDYFVISFGSGNDDVIFSELQLELGSVATSYEPYKQPQFLTIATPTGLPAIPVPSGTSGITYTDADGQVWIADEIDLERGKYVQRIGKVDLENLLWKLIGNCFRSGAISNSKVYHWTSEIANIICSHYICKMTSYNMQYNSDGQDNLIGMYANQIEIKDTRYNKDVDLFKQSLSGVYAYYVLAIPVERDLTSAELAEYIQLYSYKPTTVVENDSDCWMDVTYRGKK